jgi:dienelactone hydrolase
MGNIAIRLRLSLLASMGLLALAAAMGDAEGAIRTQAVEYKQGDVTLEGLIAYDDAATGKRPGVVVFPAWNGPTRHERDSAEKLASLGYVAFVADVYGKGIRPATPKDAAQESGKYMKDRALLRARATAALDQLRRSSDVDGARLAAIGYCFGGTTALELARSGAPIVTTVTFHGNLSNPNPEDAKNIKGHVLVLQGADDPVAPPKVVEAFENEMRNAKVDWQFVAYGGAVHSFTDPAAGSDPSTGNAYNEKADKRSWMAMQDIFRETLTK